MTNYLFFNGIELGQGVYHDKTYEETIDGISMHIGSTNAQVGVNLSDVTDYLRASDNRVGQGDDGDNMMPCNAFLVVEYKEIEVNKAVWDATSEAWVKELEANVSDTLRFRCVIHNVKTSDLTNITVVDILPDNLEYKNNATVNGVPGEPVQVGSEYEWNFTRLAPCESITIEFDAGVVKYGNCTNTVKATAWYEGTGEMVSGDDRVSVTVPCVIPTPFLLYGEVNYSTGSPVLNPDVTITNLNTAEVFTAETNASSNYYQVSTSSEHVSAGDILHFHASNGNITEFNHTVTEEEMNNGGFEQDIVITVSEKLVFDTGEGTYPSIFGMHKGEIIPDKDIVVRKMYTYPCTGTGGHAEYVKIWNSTLNVSASWNGYKGDWHNISFSKSFILKAGETYYYEIITGSYPQIIHASSKEVTGGTITCDKFIDANERRYNDWIPAIKLFL